MNAQQPLTEAARLNFADLPAARTFVREMDDRHRYLLRLAACPDPQRVLVAVHGISRNAETIMRYLAPQADLHGYTVIAPVFSYRDFPDYQRLGRQGRGERADLALLTMLEDLQKHMQKHLQKHLQLPNQFHLFGFSGGAQFAHRFICAHPARVASAALAAAGWYSDLDSRRRFPVGMGSTRRLPDLRFAARAFDSIPTLILVGENDTERDASLRRNDRLDSLQGKHRLDRARWFHQRLAANQSIAANGRQLAILKNTGHDFSEAVLKGRLDQRLFEFCNGVAVRPDVQLRSKYEDG